MKRFSLLVGGGLFVALTACTQAPESQDLGGRELRPPREGVNVGSLYYVREAQTQDLDTPALLEDLCKFDLASAGVTLDTPVRVADIDLLRNLEASGTLAGVQSRLAGLGLSGSLDRYFSYKLTNATQTAISLVDAETVFNDLGNRTRCSGWRDNIDRFGWAPYQVLSVTTGDLVFERTSEADASADVAVKVADLEPELEQAIRREFKSSIEGQGLVVSFLPLPR